MEEYQYPLYDVKLDLLEIGWLTATLKKLEAHPQTHDIIISKEIRQKLAQVAREAGVTSLVITE
jgi:hypothetical protein